MKVRDKISELILEINKCYNYNLSFQSTRYYNALVQSILNKYDRLDDEITSEEYQELCRLSKEVVNK